jgi:CRISPR/Cas system-associated endoribonuclease Cas2
MQLDTVPVYIWDDIEWLPYQDRVDYSAFSVSISQKDLPHLSNRLRSITDEQYATMQQELQRVRHYFTLEGMTEYIVKYIETH